MADERTNTTPPPATPSPTAPDTVPRSRHTGTSSYRAGDLLRGRVAILRDLGPIPIVPLEYFNSAVLPPLRKGIDVQKIEHALQASGQIKSGQWREYQSNPNDGTANEEDYYKHLCSIFTAVTKQAKKGTVTSPTVDFIQKPNSAPMSERANTSRPDGYMRLKEKKSVRLPGTDSRDFWDDVAVSFEFKKYDKDKDKQDNERKLIWSLHHIMRSDPCRRSTLGVTIEGANMRLWFTCRSVTMVSEPFDFIKDTSQLIHFFCSVAFADDHELGWDPSIRRILVNSRAQYEITLDSDNGSSIYVTTDTLADFGAEAMEGRATRVFKGYLKRDPDKTSVVIKDTWRAWDRDREDVILKEIFADMVKVDKAAAKDAQKHFLTVLDAGDVMIKGKVDDTLCLLRGENPPSDCRMYEVPPEEPPSADKLSKKTTPTHTTVPAVADFKVTHRVHTRIVFKEVCETLYAVRDLRGVVQMLLDVLKVLRVLHRSGWVHRDISPGNLMRIGESVKLADLEYAKRLDSDKTHDFRTGTHHFMACEVESQDYLFQFEEGDGPNLDVVVETILAESPTLPFTFNPIHDLESLWWIWVWVMYFYVDEDHKMHPPEQAKAFRSLFPDYIPAERLRYLQTSLKADAPMVFRRVIGYAEIIRRRLVKSYRDMETSLPPNYTHFLPDLTDSFLDALERAMNFAGDTKLYIPLEHRKRKEPEREDGNLVSSNSNKRGKRG